jgi:hypothetical protein
MKNHKVLMHPDGAKRRARVLIWDIETAPNIVTAHSLFNERGLPTSSIQREKYIICGSWKLLHAPKMYDACVSAKRPQDDEPVVRALHAALSSADAIVHHYGDAFDIRTFNGRAVYYGLKPLPPINQIDTYKVARRKFKLNSYRLDYLGQYLGLGRKLSTNYALWDGCMKGDRDALARMVRYNKQDVRLLERVFLRIYPFGASKLNIGAPLGADGCHVCGGQKLTYKGTHLVRTRFHRMLQCEACGNWETGPAVKR